MKKKYTKWLVGAALICAALFAAFVWDGSGGRPSSLSVTTESAAPAETAQAGLPAAQAAEIQTTEDAEETAEPAGAAEKTNDEVPTDAAPGPETEITETQAAAQNAETDGTAVPAVSITESESHPEEKALACTISVRCDALLSRLDALAPGKAAIVPPDGVILSETAAVFYEGESVFNVLQRELKIHGIQMEFVRTALSDSVYVEGIDNLYEFDGGDLSGWVYTVNGVSPSVGCSSCPLSDGDVVVWKYVCDRMEGIS